MVASFLEKGPCMLHLDARKFGVRVPKRFREDPELRLNFSYRFQPADLVVDVRGIRETLSFAGVPSAVSVPWHAVWGATAADGQTFVWQDSIPPEVVEKLKTLKEQVEAVAAEEIELPQEPEAPPIDDEPPPRPARKNHLKLVK